MLSYRRIVVDANVWIEDALGHEPARSDFCRMWEACAQRDVMLLYLPSTLKDVFYILPRQMRREALAAGETDLPSFKPAAWALVRRIMDLSMGMPVTHVEAEMAYSLRNRHADMEDNLLFAAAETSGADYIVTYDQQLIKDFSPVCITPAQLTNLLELSEAAK